MADSVSKPTLRSKKGSVLVKDGNKPVVVPEVYIYKAPNAKTLGLRSRGEKLVKNAAGQVTSSFTTPPVRLPFHATEDGTGAFVLSKEFAISCGCTVEEIKDLIEAYPGYGKELVLLEPGSVKPQEVKPRKKAPLRGGARGRK